MCGLATAAMGGLGGDKGLSAISPGYAMYKALDRNKTGTPQSRKIAAAATAPATAKVKF